MQKYFLSTILFCINDHKQGCLHIGDEALYQLVRRCSRLQLVNLHGCKNVQDDGVMEMAENSPALRYLCLSNCVNLTDQAIISLASNCRDLVTLECAGLHHLTDAGFQVYEIKATSESCFRVKLKEREFWQDHQLSGVLEYRNGTFDTWYGNRMLEVLKGRKY